jgi:glycosyltransferase involved in cell wall biosynthesis
MIMSRENCALTLLLPGEDPAKPKFRLKSIRYAIKDTVKFLLGRPRLRAQIDDASRVAVAELIGRLRDIHPTIRIRYSSGLESGLKNAAKDLRLDAVYMAMRAPRPRPDCAVIGYVPDYQHRHLPHLFSTSEIDKRDEIFGRLIAQSDAMVMNARAVKEDMQKFTPGTLPELHVLPFSPNLDPAWLRDRPELTLKYAIGGPYFIICNQFWMHKDHLTAFRAMAEIARIRPDVTLVCTGGTTDYRDPSYFGKLLAQAEQLGLGSNLRLLGHIPKDDQIELMKHALALVQPTLFEGGPGGGSTYEAVALGQRVLLSDLPVNLEVDDGDIRFFKRGDHFALAELMRITLGEEHKRTDPQELITKSDARLRRNGESVWASIQAAIEAKLAS